jgi:hypothetical protein
MWVNGSLQGIIPSGKTAWIEAAGFVTRDSGWQPDGTLKITPAYGGWDRRDESEVVFAGHDANGAIVFAKVSVPKENKRAQISFAGSPPPKDVELERAIHVQQGHLNISLKNVRPASDRDFARSPAGKFASADGKISLEIKPSSAGGFEATLTSFDKTYPLKLAQRGGRVRLSNDDAGLDLEAEWAGEQLALTQGSSKKLLKDLNASVETSCELAGQGNASLAGTTWTITSSKESGYWTYRFYGGGSLDYSYSAPDTGSFRGQWEQKGNTVVFGEYSNPYNFINKFEGVVKGKSMTGTFQYFNRHHGHGPVERTTGTFKGEQK